MSLQLRRGPDSARTSITPVEGEPIYTTDTNKLYVGDGVTPGGIAISATLNTATSSVVGGVKIGSGVNIAGDGTISVTAGGGVSDQALFTTSSVTFNNITVTNTLTVNESIIMQGLSIDSQGADEPGSLGYRIAALTENDDLQINNWRYILLNCNQDVAINQGDHAKSQLRVRTIAKLSTATDVNVKDTLSVGSGAAAGNITSNNTQNLVLNPGGDNLGGKINLQYGENNGVIIGNHHTANIAQFTTSTIDFNVALGAFKASAITTKDGSTNLVLTNNNQNGPGGRIEIENGAGSGIKITDNPNSADIIARFNTSTIELNKQVDINSTAFLNTTTFNGPVQFNSTVGGLNIAATTTYTTPLLFDSISPNTGKIVFTATSFARAMDIWNTEGSTGSLNYSDIRFFRKRGTNTLSANNVMGAINVDGFQTTNGYASDYANNKLFPGIRWIAGTWSANSAGTSLQIFNRVNYSANAPYPYNITNSQTTDTTVMLSASFAPTAFQYSGNLTSPDYYQGFNSFAGTGTALITGVFGSNRMGSSNAGNQFQVRQSSAFGDSATFPGTPSIVQFRSRTDHIPYQSQGYGGLNTTAAGQINWTAGSTATWSSYLAPSIVKGTRLDLNSTRYQQLERTVQRTNTVYTANALWNTSTQAGDVLGTVSFQGGLSGVSDSTLNEGGVDGVIIRAYAKNNWQGEQTSTTTNVTYTNNQSALRIEVTTSTTIGPMVISGNGFSQLYKTVFEVDATTATFFTTDVAQAGIVQRNAYITTATTETATLAVIDTSQFPSADFSVSIVDTGEIHFTRLNIIGDGTDAWKTEYGINTTNGALGTFDITTGTNTVNLTFTPTAATAMKIRVQGTYFTQ